MTQKQKVLAMLKAAGSFGVRSDAYIRDFMPRAAARIKELRDEGYNITSEREGKYTRWTLQTQRSERDVRQHADAKPPQGPECVGLGGSEEPGDKTEVPAAVSEDTLVGSNAEGKGSVGDPAGHERAPGPCGDASEPQSLSVASSEAGLAASQSNLGASGAPGDASLALFPESPLERLSDAA